MPTPSERKLQAQLAALTRWSREDPAGQVAKMLAGQTARFEREVDPMGVLDPAERARRAENARQAHMKRMALRSAQARRARKAGEAA